MTLHDARLLMLRAQWELRRAGARAIQAYGIVAIVTGALSVAALAVFAWALLLAQNAEDAGVRLAEQSRERAHMPPPVQQDPLQRVDSLRTALPPSTHIPEVIQQLFALASREKLQLRIGEYKVLTDAATSTQTCRIRLPITGNAAAVQRFAISAINEHRSLAIESLSMRRERVDAAEVEANLQFVLVTSAPSSVTQAGGAT